MPPVIETGSRSAPGQTGWRIQEGSRCVRHCWPVRPFSVRPAVSPSRKTRPTRPKASTSRRCLAARPRRTTTTPGPPPIPGGAATPTPGTVVIRLNGKVYADVDLSYGTGLQTAKGTIVPASGATPNAAGYKLNPVGVASYFRLYPGIDGMATNGLRYGAAVEIRENFEGGNSFSVSSATATTPASTAITTNLPSGTATSGTNASASGDVLIADAVRPSRLRLPRGG